MGLVLVTGASAGLGLATVTALLDAAREGCATHEARSVTAR